MFQIFLPSNVFKHVWDSDPQWLICFKMHWNILKPPDGSSDVDIVSCPRRVEPTFSPWKDERQEFEAEKQSLCIAGFRWASATGRGRWGRWTTLNNIYIYIYENVRLQLQCLFSARRLENWKCWRLKSPSLRCNPGRNSCHDFWQQNKVYKNCSSAENLNNPTWSSPVGTI